tara:strand:- start:105 stop:218 length:114 start_codon:yes stop_codon:yes gene_type:complete
MTGAYEPGWVEVDCEVGIHRACLTATPVVTDIAYHWH